MNYKSNIRFINSHPKCYGSNNHVGFFHQEFILIGYSKFLIQSSVVRQRIHSIDLQKLSKFFHFSSAKTINDSGFSFMLVDKLDNFFVYINFRAYFVKQISSVKTFFENQSIVHSQSFLNIILNFRCCSSR